MQNYEYYTNAILKIMGHIEYKTGQRFDATHHDLLLSFIEMVDNKDQKRLKSLYNHIAKILDEMK